MQYKIGLDTSVLVNLYVKNIDIASFIKSMPNNSEFYYCHKNETEFKGVLKREYRKSDREANLAWDELSDELDLEMISWKSEINSFIERIKKVSEKIDKDRNQGFTQTFKIGDGDLEIIAYFMAGGLDRIYTSDNAFFLTCKVLDLNAIKLKVSDYSVIKLKV
jgi:hypothetical protein